MREDLDRAAKERAVAGEKRVARPTRRLEDREADVHPTVEALLRLLGVGRCAVGVDAEPEEFALGEPPFVPSFGGESIATMSGL